MRFFVVLLCAAAVGCPGAPPTQALELRAVHHSAQNAGNDVARTFANDLGQQIVLTRGYVVVSRVELLPCTSTARRLWELLSPVGTAWAHGESGPTILAEGVVLNLLRADGAAKTLGTIEPPVGSYCSARVTFAPADAHARDLPTDVALTNQTFWLEGEGFSIQSALSGTVEVPIDPPVDLSEDGGQGRWTFGLAYDTWFNGVDMTAVDPAAAAQVILPNITASVHNFEG